MKVPPLWHVRLRALAEREGARAFPVLERDQLEYWRRLALERQLAAVPGMPIAERLAGGPDLPPAVLEVAAVAVAMKAKPAPAVAIGTYVHEHFTAREQLGRPLELVQAALTRIESWSAEDIAAGRGHLAELLAAAAAGLARERGTG